MTGAQRRLLFGAVFLMATSAIGPAFLTQTAVFTEQYLASFAFAILASIVIDIGAQLNIWRVLSVSGKRGQDVANAVAPGLGHVVAFLIVLGGFAFNIGNVFKDGILTDTVENITEYWQDDFVTFLIGCSFTFEQAILDEGLSIKHIDEGRNVAMYKTNIATDPAGVFSGELVVSMRPFDAGEVERVTAVTNQFPTMHGGPVHYGDPVEIGIKDINQPEYGEAIEIGENAQPVFWACGVTPQNAALNAKPHIMITHAPGHMFVTDLENEDYRLK